MEAKIVTATAMNFVNMISLSHVVPFAVVVVNDFDSTDACSRSHLARTLHIDCVRSITSNAAEFNSRCLFLFVRQCISFRMSYKVNANIFFSFDFIFVFFFFLFSFSLSFFSLSFGEEKNHWHEKSTLWDWWEMSRCENVFFLSFLSLCTFTQTHKHVHKREHSTEPLFHSIFIRSNHSLSFSFVHLRSPSINGKSTLDFPQCAFSVLFA